MKTIKRVRLVVFKGSELLLLKKAAKKNYTFPGGVVKENETLKEGLIREVLEEIGTQITKNDIKHLASISTSKKNKKYANHYFLLGNPRDFSYTLLEPLKFSELSWVNIVKASNSLKYYEKFIVDDILLRNYYKSYNDFI